MRIESVTITMPQAVYNQMLMLCDNIKYRWESIVNENLKIEDLDENAILGDVRTGIESGRLSEITIREDIPTILGKLELKKDGQLINAAAILFGKDFSAYPQCLLRLARFKGTTKDEFIDNQQIKGNIFELIDAAMAFFFKHLSLSSISKLVCYINGNLAGRSPAVIRV